MASLSKKSLQALSTCCPELQAIVKQVILILDFSVIYGYRDGAKQDELFEQGLSKKKGGESKHNEQPSEAVDLAPYPINWKDSARFYVLASAMITMAHMLGYVIRWGGDWDSDGDLSDQSFMDLGHFEYIGRRS